MTLFGCECRLAVPAHFLAQKLETLEYTFSSNDFLILSQPRSSSTYLVELVNKRLGVFSEYELLHPNRGHSYVQLRNQLSPRSPFNQSHPAELAKALKLIYKNGWWNNRGVFTARNPSTPFGFKTMPYQIGDQSISRLLTDFQMTSPAGRLKIVFLTRQPFVLCALSLLEAKKQLKWSYSPTDVAANRSILNWANPDIPLQLVSDTMDRCLRHHFYEEDLRSAEQKGLLQLLPVTSAEVITKEAATLDRISRFLSGRPAPADKPRVPTVNARGRSSVDIHVRIPNLPQLVPRLLKLLSAVQPALPALLTSPHLLEICRLKLNTEFLQLGA